MSIPLHHATHLSQVLEPWITPSLFYQFLGKGQSTTAMDSYTFCEVLGPEGGKAALQEHTAKWVQASDIADLAKRGVEMVRVPVGDWLLAPYGPYVGCTEGQSDAVHWVLDECQKHGIKVLLDIHAMRDSQNGFDNSGRARDVQWTDEHHFEHWPHLSASWVRSLSCLSSVFRRPLT